MDGVADSERPGRTVSVEIFSLNFFLVISNLTAHGMNTLNEN